MSSKRKPEPKDPVKDADRVMITACVMLTAVGLAVALVAWFTR